MAGELLTGPGQYQIRDLVMGRGTAYPVEAVEGLGLPEVRAADLPRGGSDGAWPAGPDLLVPRRVVITGGTFESNGWDVAARVGALAAAWAPVRDGDVDLVVWRDGWAEPRFCKGRPRRVSLPDEGGRWRLGQAILVAEFVALDPVLYALTELSDTITIGASATSAQGTVTMEGTYRTAPVVEVAGPARNPRLTNADDGGRAMRVDVDVEAGSTLVMDAAARTVQLDGVDAYEYVRGDHEWWDLLAGENALTYSRDAGGLTGASSTVTVRWHDGYLA